MNQLDGSEGGEGGIMLLSVCVHTKSYLGQLECMVSTDTVQTKQPGGQSRAWGAEFNLAVKLQTLCFTFSKIS